MYQSVTDRSQRVQESEIENEYIGTAGGREPYPSFRHDQSRLQAFSFFTCVRSSRGAQKRNGPHAARNIPGRPAGRDSLATDTAVLTP